MSNTLQLWPSGKSVTYDGSYPHLTVDGAPVDEQTAIAIQTEELARVYAERDVFCCDSSLVEKLIAEDFDGFAIDDIENVFRDFSDSSVEDCREYIDDMGGDAPSDNPWTMDRAAMVDALESVGIVCDDDEDDDTLRAAVIANMDDETIDGLQAWRDEASDLASENPQDAYEWWRVTSWLCKELRAIGEIVIDNDYGCWWGRTCTGQGYIMDGTLQRIAANVLSR